MISFYNKTLSKSGMDKEINKFEGKLGLVPALLLINSSVH